MTPGFKTNLVVEPGTAGNYYKWFTAKPLEYLSNSGFWYVVPSEFPTDGATIPRIFHSIFSPTGRYFRAAVLHDWLLVERDEYDLTRKECDAIFYEAMLHCEVNKTRALFLWAAVRLWGLLKLDF